MTSLISGMLPSANNVYETQGFGKRKETENPVQDAKKRRMNLASVQSSETFNRALQAIEQKSAPQDALALKLDRISIL